MPLTVDLLRVDGREVGIQQFVQRNHVRVVLDAHSFAVPGQAGRYVAIAGRNGVAVGIAAYGAVHSVDLLHKALQPEETAACKVDHALAVALNIRGIDEADVLARKSGGRVFDCFGGRGGNQRLKRGRRSGRWRLRRRGGLSRRGGRGLSRAHRGDGA